MAVLLASAFSMPLAYFISRFEFKGAVIIQSLGIIPLIMPPFVVAVAMLMLFGRNGSVNLLLDEWFGFTIPFMEGLKGVIFVQHRALFLPSRCHRRRAGDGAIVYIVLHTKLIGRQWLDYIAMAAVAIPGVVIAIGYLRTFYGYHVPWLENQSFATW